MDYQTIENKCASIFKGRIMKSFNLEVGDIHIWIGTKNKIMVSCETTKKLMAFDTFDNAINGLFLSGKREAARALNSAVNQ